MTSKDTHVLFDYCVSNPPYQMELNNGYNNATVNIFHRFYAYGLSCCNDVRMIFPGGRWMQQAHRGREAADIIFPTVDSIRWYPHGNDSGVTRVFPGVYIPDGVVVVSGCKNQNNKIFLLNGIWFPYIDNNSTVLPLTSTGVSIMRKLYNRYDHYLIDKKQSTTVFGLRSFFVERNPGKVADTQTDYYNTKAWLTDDNKGTRKRVRKYFINSGLIDWDKKNITKIYSKYKVCAVKEAGAYSDSATYRVVGNNTVIGESWYIFGLFNTEQEAINYKKYLDTKTVRKLLSESKGGKMKTWGHFVPDLEDYTSRNPHIDWDKPLDPQLYKLFNLTNEEINTIENS